MLDTIRYLSVAIGPRPSASTAEGQAADWCADRLLDAGFETRLQLFSAVPTFTAYVAPIYAASTLAGMVLARGFRRTAALLSVPAALAYIAEQSYVPLVSRIVLQQESTNVVGYMPAQNERWQTVVLTAHLDTQHAALFFHPRLVAGFRRSYLLFLFGLIWTALLSLWRLVRPAENAGWPERLAQLFSLNAVSGLFMLLHRHLFLPHVDGANDNASGVAVTLAAAEELAGTLEYTDLWIVLTGSEETGSHGMLHFLDTHSFDPDTTYFVNVDNCGAGTVTAVDREGPLTPYGADPRLVGLARRAITQNALDVDVRPYHQLGTDAEPAMACGYRAMSVMALDENGIPLNWHWTTDTAEHIEPATLETARRLVAGIVRMIEDNISLKPQSLSQ